MNSIFKVIRTDSTSKVSVIASKKNWLESSAIEQLAKTAELPGMRYSIGMPDLHPGRGQPIGAAFISQDWIYPHLVGSDIGCGMRLCKLDLNTKKLKLDRLEKRLTGLDDADEALIQDQLAAYKLKTEDQELIAANTKLGTIGGGNHFAEIQLVKKIYDADSFASLNLDKTTAVLLVHSGSRGLGQMILSQHVKRFGPKGLQAKSEAAKAYFKAHDYAMQWAVANRDLIVRRICQLLDVQQRSLLDVTHNMVLPLGADFAGALNLDASHQYWIHRKGASPVQHNYVVIPGSRGSLSYLVKPKTDMNVLAQGGFSLAHGAGRKWNRSESKGRLMKRYQAKQLTMTEFGSRVICANKNLLFEEAPQAYKNIDVVVNDLVEAGLIDLIAAFKPVITYKTRKTK